jgi:putative copper resistance protein D
VAGFVDVILRGLALTGQAVAIGGVLFALLILRARPGDVGFVRVWTLVTAGAAVVAVAQAGMLALLAGALDAPAGTLAARLMATQYFRATVARALAAVVLVIAALAVRRAPRVGTWWPLLLGGAMAMVISAAWTSHAAARLDHRASLLVLDALHQVAASAWIGGLLCLMVVAFRRGPSPAPAAIVQRFSTLAIVAVSVLVAAGVGLALSYVDGARALVGTAYGLMVMTKAVLLGGLLVLGAFNNRAVRRLDPGEPLTSVRLRRFVEVEFGIGVTVLFAAASLTSLPPAVDVVADRATPAEVAGQFAPRWPTLASPPHESLPFDDPDAPRTDADRAWSEYNHHISGLFVLLMGLLSLTELAGVSWARHWPLVFLGLAAFMLVRNDPGAWPLGPQGFWAGMAEPSVLQHRVFVLVVIVFGLFEWMVRTGRLTAPRCALLFPLLAAVGGGLLLTHSHASLNLKTEFLMEVTHAPLGVLAVLIGWGRWLQLRLSAPEGRLPGRLAASAMTVIGVLLLLYRES